MNKQIEEMARDIRLNRQITPKPNEHPDHKLARLLFQDGYRKQSEGEWITIPDTQPDRLTAYRHICRVCGYTHRNVIPMGSNFCPNCGAKMKGGETDA